MTYGYRSPLYARAFAHLGWAVDLPECGGHVLLRPVPSSDGVDAQGCYPVFSCGEPTRLAADIRELSARVPSPLVTVSLVPDPLLDWPDDALREIFPVRRALAPHVVIEPGNWTETVSAHHRRAISRAERHGLDISVEEQPLAFIPEWCALYDTLVTRASITGLRRFSPAIFEAMAVVPGTRIVSARLHGAVVGADWYFLDEARAYAHLSAYSDEGYRVGASYPLMAAALEDLAARGIERLDIGGVPANRESDGLGAFKAGWSPLRRSSTFLGAVIDARRYADAGGQTGRPADAFFPIYRRSDY